MEHLNPADRAHLWERPLRADEQPAVPVDREYPKHLHRAGSNPDEPEAFVEVTDAADEAAKRAEGWA